MDLESRLLRLASRQHSLITRRQTAAEGASREASRHLFDDHPRWEALTDEVLQLRGAVRTDAQRAMAAVLDAGPGAKLSHLSAGNRWGLSCSLHPLHVITTSSSTRKTTLARVHKVRVLPETWTTVLDGIPIVRPELLALQIYAVSRDDRAEALVERLWSLRLLSGRSIAAFLSQQGERGRNRTAGLRRYLEPRGDGYEPTATNLETRAMQILRSADIPMRRQIDSGGDHWDGRVDLRHESLPLIVEVQSAMHHDALRFRRLDDARADQLVRDGFEVVDVWDDEIFVAPWVAIARVREGLAELATGSVGRIRAPRPESTPQNR